MKIKNVSNNVNFNHFSFEKNDMVSQSLKNFNEVNNPLLVENYQLDDESIGIEEINNVFDSYDLSDEQLLKLSRLCIQEQGSVKGAAAEASLMANRFEINLSGKYKGEKGAEGLYNYVKNSGAWENSEDYMENGSQSNPVTDEVIDAVENVLINGKRTIPKYVNEHDGISGLEYVTNDGEEIDKSEPSQYIPHISRCKQAYKDPITWTYYCHPDKGSDPFGYDSEELREKYGEGHYDFDTGKYVEK